MYTDANGYYSTTTSSSQTVYLQAGYKVGSVYVASSNVVKITVLPKVSTTLTLASTNDHPAVGQQYTLSGSLTDNAGKGLAYRPIDIYYVFAGGTAWHYSNTVYTGADGTYSTPTSSSQTVHLKTVFNGENGYTYSASTPVTINVV